MKKKKPLAKLKKDLWRQFTKFIKKRDKGICFTCGTKAYGKNYHGGHFIKKSIGGLLLYFHEDNVHGQCARCNLWLDGDQYTYGIKLGKETVDRLLKLLPKSKKTVWDRAMYEKMIEFYKLKNKKK